MKAALPNLKSLPYGGASAVIDTDLDLAINNIIHEESVSSWLSDTQIHVQFLHEYQHWISSSQHNTFVGLDKFPIACYSAGTSESFDKFYLKNRTRRFRCFRGEYMYHMASWRNYFPDWKYIEDDEIQANDAVVISLPFSDTGNPHSSMQEVLDKCTQLKVPVLVDCAFMGICHRINFDFTHPCITDITFSLSKTFPVSHVRIGMRLTRTDDDDSLIVHHKTAYVNRIGAGLGRQLIKQWGPDYNYIRWGDTQQQLCEELNIAPSSTIIFGIDSNDRYSQYNRGTATNRLCLSKYLFTGKLPYDQDN